MIKTQRYWKIIIIHPKNWPNKNLYYSRIECCYLHSLTDVVLGLTLQFFFHILKKISNSKWKKKQKTRYLIFPAIYRFLKENWKFPVFFLWFLNFLFFSGHWCGVATLIQYGYVQLKSQLLENFDYLIWVWYQLHWIIKVVQYKLLEEAINVVSHSTLNNKQKTILGK